MNSPRNILWQRLLAASVVLVFSWTLDSRAQNAPPPIPAGEQPEVLTRGPVHEAFAEPVILQYQVGLVAPVQPPENIDEIPPADRPAGDQFAWVPGYWSWDGDRNNYIWVSACWRAVPPSMAWVPGYWNRVVNGWEWVAGFWTPAGVQEIEYLPAPPANDDIDAPGAPPIVDSSWVPPCWYWSDGRYVQRSGYWLAAQPGWIWVASHYVWTPRGYVFANGHWDYPLEDRGVLFAPVYIQPTVYARVGYTYSPSIVIDVDLLSASLFVSPRYSHYYFGDYYDDAYIRIGIFAWFDRDRIPDYYDPIYNYDRSRRGQLAGRWETQERHDYDDRRAHVELRPARTYREMETRIARAPEPQRRALQVVQPLSVVVNNSTTTIVNNTNVTNVTNNQLPGGTATANPRAVRSATPVKFEKITPAVQTKIASQAADVKKFGNDRKAWEATAANPKAVQTPTVQRAPEIAPTAARGPAAAPPAAATPNAPASPAPTAPPPVRGRATDQSPGRNPAVIPPTAAREPAATPPTDRKPPTAAEPTLPTPTAPPPVRGRATDQSPGRNPAVIPPTATREPAATPPVDRKPPTAAEPTQPTPTAPPAARGEPAAASRKPAAAPPREVPVAQPEKVKLPSRPVVIDARPAPAADKGPPPKPVKEAKEQPEPKSPSKKDDAPTSRPNDSSPPGGRGGGNGRGDR